MRAEVVIASVIVMAGALASGQAIRQGLQDPPKAAPPAKVTDPALTRCADAYETPTEGDRRMTIAVVGDRVTSWRPPDDRETSWASYVSGDGVRLRRSWVDREARARDLADEVDRSDADVLVVLVGTNDLTSGAAPDDIELGLTRIAAAAGVDDVLVSSIPPIDRLAQRTADFNVLLSRIAYRHGWSFVDAGASVLRPDCTYRHDLTTDGVRPSAAGAQTIGEAIRAVLTTRADLAPAG